MIFENFLSLLTIAIISAWTPGPNNTLITNSSARFGLYHSIPHIIGIGLGFSFMAFCISIGLGTIFEQSVIIRETLRITGIIVLIWIAWKIATAGIPDDNKNNLRPFTFIGAASFQWINPKAWVMAISVSSQFTNPDAKFYTALIIAFTFLIVGLLSATSWALFGMTMRRWITTKSRANLFNGTMAALLLLSVVIIAFSHLKI